MDVVFMTDINLSWLSENFTSPITVFDIGCADLADTIKLKQALPLESVFYAFDCAEIWKERNIITAKEHGINYFHLALSDNMDEVTFYPSERNYDEDWPWSGSIYSPGEHHQTNGLKWGELYYVKSTTLENFCDEYGVEPSFIHIDVQGAEYAVFKNLGNTRPIGIWAEISEFQSYNTNATYNEFHDLMLGYGYRQEFRNNQDALYVLQDFESLTPYKNK